MKGVTGTLATAIVAALLATPAMGAPVDAIRAGDMDAMIPEIIAVYEDAGLSWDRGIKWNVGPFTTTYWYYDPNTDEILAGAVPADDEIGPYWQTWSDALTDGNFVPAEFFASEEEARELARYNQYVLATHEAAHAITFRYDYGHLRRHGYDINCREYYADRLTVAILNEQARLDPDMARWRARYLELVTAMGETIPEQYRYHIAHFAALDADCALIDVAQPTPETMQPYASAYFERYRVLLEADLPPMVEVFETHLTAVRDETLKDIPYAPVRDRLELVTLGTANEIRLGPVYGEERSESDVVSRAAAFGPDGVLWFATLHYDPATRMADLSFGINPATSSATGAPREWIRPSVSLSISSLAVLSPERFLLTLHNWDREGEAGAERHYVTFVLGERRESEWTLTTLADVDGMQQGAVLRSPSDRLFMIATPEGPGGQPTQGWRGFEMSLAPAEVVGELPIASGFRFPLAIDDEMRLYEELGYMLWGSTPEGTDAVVMGNGLAGPRDGVGARAELSDVQVLQWMPGGRALIVDRGPGREGWRLREMRPAQ
jgi:hypothetical protein